jgi:hypothetical protein
VSQGAGAIETPKQLDVAVLERQALEELAVVANRWQGRFPDDSDFGVQLKRLAAHAPRPRPTSA